MRDSGRCVYTMTINDDQPSHAYLVSLDVPHHLRTNDRAGRPPSATQRRARHLDALVDSRPSYEAPMPASPARSSIYSPVRKPSFVQEEPRTFARSLSAKLLRQPPGTAAKTRLANMV